MLEGTFCYENNLGLPVRLDPSSIAIVCMSHESTNSGIINPAEASGERIKANNQKQTVEQGNKAELCHSISNLVDACQSVGQSDVND